MIIIHAFLAGFSRLLFHGAAGATVNFVALELIINAHISASLAFVTSFAAVTCGMARAAVQCVAVFLFGDA